MEQNYYQPQQPQQAPFAKPDSNLVWGILTTILCCMPFGIVSIVMASKVDPLWFAGRYQEACEAARSARNWALAAAITGVVIILIYVIYVIYVASQVADAASYDYSDYYYY